jgi:hypothetical protein
MFKGFSCQVEILKILQSLRPEFWGSRKAASPISGNHLFDLLGPEAPIRKFSALPASDPGVIQSAGAIIKGFEGRSFQNI